MTLNPAYDEIGKGFVQQYYALFDDPAQRPQLVNMYNVDSSFMTFEGIQIQGGPKIMEKLSSLTFQKISRIITAVDSQPMFDGGVLINVLGRLQLAVRAAKELQKKLKTSYDQVYIEGPLTCLTDLKNPSLMTDDDPPHGFSHVFVLKPLGNSFYCAHDIFRLSIHNNA